MLKDYMERQEAADFMKSVAMQFRGRNYTEETLETATNTMISIFKRAEGMTEDDADSYLTTCLAVYILASYETEQDIITDIKPGE